jgi:flagellar hook-length control protein FliK
LGDGANRGGNTPIWVPITSPGTTPTTTSATPGFTPIGLSGLEPQADIRAAAASAPAAPVRLNLALPVTSPDFPQAMGAQLAVLAQGGVERAELHLHPAEMGPVSVQIAIEGTQARIDFGADVAATRQIIENGLPELASALRDAGLTLTGGGVSQHSRSREDMAEAQARGNARGGNADQGPADSRETPTPPRRMVRAGGVDMYA